MWGRIHKEIFPHSFFCEEKTHHNDDDDDNDNDDEDDKGVESDAEEGVEEEKDDDDDDNKSVDSDHDDEVEEEMDDDDDDCDDRNRKGNWNNAYNVNKFVLQSSTHKMTRYIEC